MTIATLADCHRNMVEALTECEMYLPPMFMTITKHGLIELTHPVTGRIARFGSLMYIRMLPQERFNKWIRAWVTAYKNLPKTTVRNYKDFLIVETTKQRVGDDFLGVDDDVGFRNLEEEYDSDGELKAVAPDTTYRPIIGTAINGDPAYLNNIHRCVGRRTGKTLTNDDRKLLHTFFMSEGGAYAQTHRRLAEVDGDEAKLEGKLTAHERDILDGFPIRCAVYKRAELSGVEFNVFSEKGVSDSSACAVNIRQEQNGKMWAYARILDFLELAPCYHPDSPTMQLAKIVWFHENDGLDGEHVESTESTVLRLAADHKQAYEYVGIDAIRSTPVITLADECGAVDMLDARYRAKIAHQRKFGPFYAIKLDRKGYGYL